MSDQLDMVVVGAGFAGIYQLYKARKLGLTARVLEAGDGVGGTWFWNRYPGARCDVESLDYSYSFDKALEQEWDWSERYAAQPEILRYMNHVVDLFQLRDGIQVNTRVVAATFDESANLWTVKTNTGESIVAQHLVMATGCLSVPQKLEIPGLDAFKGKRFHSADWPTEGVDFSGMRVGLIGTGSSGVQMVPLIAEQARHLTVFQRTASYSVPAFNEPISPEALAEAKANYAERRARGREAVTGHYLIANNKSALEVSAEDRQKEFEFRWNGAGGGFRMLRAFNDLVRHPESNRYAAEFCRSKIRGIVKDPKTADLLCPREDLPFGGKRLCVDTDYYETFNRNNVALVDIKTTPIVRVTENGVETAAAKFELDALVFATGFDAMTGALTAIDITGANGEKLKSKWEAGPLTYLGISVAGFPNMFIVAGPGSPSVLSNMVHSIETHVDWIADLITCARDQGKQRIEANEQDESRWVAHLSDLAAKTLYPKGSSWYLGANVPGKPRVFMPYVAGVPEYRRVIEEVAAKNYEGFTIS
jgi:cyclohexanone monooxygenase